MTEREREGKKFQTIQDSADSCVYVRVRMSIKIKIRLVDVFFFASKNDALRILPSLSIKWKVKEWNRI